MNTDSYIAMFPENTQRLLQQLRTIIHNTAPNATEVISYKMPAFKLNKVLVYYAAYSNHIGFYPTAAPIQFFESELKSYKTSKGAIQFPLDKPLPVELIEKIVRFRLEADRINSLKK